MMRWGEVRAVWPIVTFWVGEAVGFLKKSAGSGRRIKRSAWGRWAGKVAKFTGGGWYGGWTNVFLSVEAAGTGDNWPPLSSARPLRGFLLLCIVFKGHTSLTRDCLCSSFLSLKVMKNKNTPSATPKIATFPEVLFPASKFKMCLNELIFVV